PFELANAAQWGLIPTGTRTAPGEPLFPRIDLEALHEDIAGKDAEEPVVPSEQVAAAPATEVVATTTEGAAATGTTLPSPTATSSSATSSSAALLITEADDGAAELEHKADITINDFARVELRVVTVIAAEQHPNADKLLVLTVSLGVETRTVVSGIKAHYQPETLVGKRLVLVTNLQPVKLRGIESQGMILAAEDDAG